MLIFRFSTEVFLRTKKREMSSRGFLFQETCSFTFQEPTIKSFNFFNESLQTLLSKDYEKMKIIAYLSKNQNSKVNCSITKLSCQK